jgi:hypothetical protein
MQNLEKKYNFELTLEELQDIVVFLQEYETAQAKMAASIKNGDILILQMKRNIMDAMSIREKLINQYNQQHNQQQNEI